MTIIFSVVGLLAFRNGRMWGGRGLGPYVVEGPGVRIAGLLMFVLDVLPLFVAALLWLPSAFGSPGLSYELSTYGILTMFGCFTLNILLYGFCMMFGRRAGH